MRLVLFEPEIPPNTGNVARLCAGMNVPLHLVEPLGFSIDDKHLKRAGLDYWPNVELTVHPDWADLRAHLRTGVAGRYIGTSARSSNESGGTSDLQDFAFRPDDVLVLGPETRGLPPEIRADLDGLVRIPITDKVRSLNLSTAAGILLFEALRQTHGLPG